MEPHLSQGGYFLRFVVALLLGVAIGLEREWRQRMAGMHTTALVAAGAAIFAMIAPLLEAKGADPTRIAAQVVSGIGFLAGGVILRQGANVRGLTTAATLWATSAVGVLVGFGFLTEAVGASAAIIIANIILYPLTRYIDSIKRETRDVVTTYTLDVTCNAGAESDVRNRTMETLSATQITLTSVESSNVDATQIRLRVTLSRHGRDDRTIETLAKELKTFAGVNAVQWQAQSQYL